MQVFVSYQRADTLYVAHMLYFALRHAGHGAFVDTGELPGGAAFQTAIEAELAASNLVLALVGPQFDVARLREATSAVAFEWRGARRHRCAVVPVVVDGATLPRSAVLPVELRWFPRANAHRIRQASCVRDVAAVVADVPRLSAEPRRAARVLWVDDRPANNELERRLLRPSGIAFDNVVSTQEAIEQLAVEEYDLVITDLGREGSSDRSHDAGAAFLEHPVVRGHQVPVVVYAGTWAVARRPELMARGALGVMSSRKHLIATVLRTLGRAEEPTVELSR